MHPQIGFVAKSACALGQIGYGLTKDGIAAYHNLVRHHIYYHFLFFIAYTKLGNKTLKLWKASLYEGESEAKPGSIIYVDKKTLRVQCGKDALDIERLQLEGKKAMDTDAFLRGYSIALGDKLGGSNGRD